MPGGHPLLRPTLIDEAPRAIRELAKNVQVAFICIKAYAAPLAQEVLQRVGVGRWDGGLGFRTAEAHRSQSCLNG